MTYMTFIFDGYNAVMRDIGISTCIRLCKDLQELPIKTSKDFTNGNVGKGKLNNGKSNQPTK